VTFIAGTLDGGRRRSCPGWAGGGPRERCDALERRLVAPNAKLRALATMLDRPSSSRRRVVCRLPASMQRTAGSDYYGEGHLE